MMKIYINDQEFEVQEAISVIQATELYGAKAPFALALNGQFIAQQAHATTQLKAGDSIDILSPIQGG
ncbi:sulfur carrier protein ThiS [Pseudoalteromonas sp. SSDWG2]|uniref:sulfur carrier protein ThiS n=1 Tax=Pseudoalteromonas sp. SSDWG2 TaxID=3139391 RepID=UPI003BAB8E56